MHEDPLHLEIMRDTLPGDGPFTVRDIAKRWSRSERLCTTVLDWMAAEQIPPTMKKIANTSPQLWRRI